MIDVVLASASPRRKQILEQIGIRFEVVPSTKEEQIVGHDVDTIVRDLAKKKAQDVGLKIGRRNCVIIGADTLVYHHGKILGKPKDEVEAKAMLRELQGDYHSVYTGVAVIIQNEKGEAKVIRLSDVTKVKVKHMKEKQIENYVATKEFEDKAGAYAIQGRFSVYVERIEGDYFTVLGLPIGKIYEALLQYNIVLF